ncbi:glycosyltransferase [Shouchella patagoniensis]|uniref:glycosyltransferase n=1 Tax=Shouchella patagoniensis TaxID=228576 RepID=UPI00099545E2|nr:glycosyltransferase [Shouchella patagoniensis]
MKTSIVMLTYNQLELTQQCLTSLFLHTDMEETELIIIDNGSTDGTRDYLQKDERIKLVLNDQNVGFAKGCNQGIELASGDEIVFLNNDTILTENWLASMQHAMYSDKAIGMVGPMSNYVSGNQLIENPYTSLDQLPAYAKKRAKEYKGQLRFVLRLVGFCLLVKREVIEKIGPFDERYEVGSFEDDDFCLRGVLNGFKLVIALDAHVHHHGHATFTGSPEINFNQIYWENRARFTEKWRTDVMYFMHPRPELVNLVPKDAKQVLDIGCGAGASGLELINRQGCRLTGIEGNSEMAHIAKTYYEDVLVINLDEENPEFEQDFFDTLLFADVLEHLKDPWTIVQHYSKFLKPGGSIIASIPNITHAEALLPMLMGRFDYADAGILDRTHLRFFTPQTILTLFPESQFTVRQQFSTNVPIPAATRTFFYEVSLLGKKFGFDLSRLGDDVNVYQSIIRLKKR